MVVPLRHLYLIACLWLLSCNSSTIRTLKEWEKSWRVNYSQRKCELYRILSHRLEKRLRFFSSGWSRNLPWLALQYLLRASDHCEQWMLYVQQKKKTKCKNSLNSAMKASQWRTLKAWLNRLFKHQWEFSEECCHTSQMWWQINISLPVLSTFWPWIGSHGRLLLLNLFVEIVQFFLVWGLIVNG